MTGTVDARRCGLPLPKLALVGGLALAGWVLAAALTGSSASADELPGSDTAVTAQVPRSHSQHHKREVPAEAPDTESGESSGSVEAVKPPAPEKTTTKTAEAPVAEPQQLAAAAEEPEPVAAPKRQHNTAAPLAKQSSNQGGGLLGGLVGGLLNIVSGTLNTLTSVVTDVTETVLPQPSPNPDTHRPAPVVTLPLIGDVLDPVFDGSSGGGISGGGGVTVSVPGLDTRAPLDAVTAVVTEVSKPAEQAAPEASAAAEQATRPAVAVAHTLRSLVKQDDSQPSDTHAGVDNGGGSGGGGSLPSTPSAPAAPTTTANAGHDSSGGARQPFAILGSASTTTQLKLIGVSRDHEVDGAGREAALPATSPD